MLTFSLRIITLIKRVLTTPMRAQQAHTSTVALYHTHNLRVIPLKPRRRDLRVIPQNDEADELPFRVS
ncbi:hypothetical protein HBI56_017220 [Parastagonospora nodorum]|uniref:Secreted protein n=1 Tax=Phaeosphaeria nodorum (strain SN15 / ATCC MYA-4574 / FGSC 10173) TaxID=321614 RepID=A0A7U2I274_PHANO|nr:hypothetical protein HBH56_082790 [Parastagonospora nodorum]QRC96687.1 hypothetical protein JI435_409440 [Parastagonospora nodorum SN15]KAH3929927.1 hypothetical protein HBH54_119050 [Parastagonospora nodorum]KAH3955737.1 hypothetical protein HBH53_005520 [Parastagonospora nodorum]KAH3976977.1 hypothetical protein HBH51_076000 [Parastagonospora nodorum]